MLELREITAVGIFVRIIVAMLLGGLIGLERGIKNRPAGFRTYMLVSIGACIVMLVNQYSYQATGAGDPTRMGAQVISGIGFLGAGTIIVTSHNQIKGLTTAAGLWASACMGLAVGAGFYECVALAFVLIFLAVHVLPAVELYVIENARNMNIYVEFQSLDNVAEIINRIKAQDVTIYEVEVDHGKQTQSQHPNAIFSLRMNQPGTHAKILATVSELEDVYVVHDI